VNPVGNSINGSRTRRNNFQIDGADNNDGFQNNAAVNHGGVSGIAGVLLPVEAIDQFSVASSGSAEINVVMKSGTNELHCSAFYYNRNEYFAANTPLTPGGTKVRRIRNSQGGFSAGGPILKNRTFYFVTGEYQKADAANATGISTLSPAWISQGASSLGAFGIPQNPVTASLVSFYPADQDRPRHGQQLFLGRPQHVRQLQRHSED
jgi:hypothetical protein